MPADVDSSPLAGDIFHCDTIARNLQNVRLYCDDAAVKRRGSEDEILDRDIDG